MKQCKKIIKQSQSNQIKYASKLQNLRHPRKDNNSTSSQAWRRRKLLGGHCECLEKQAFVIVIID
ncbi:hypothetical protein JHK82_013770 [Glycine max]|nr:hypothetical protein JHK82_013770 [Glycine max]